MSPTVTIVFLFLALVPFAVAIWVARDARRHGQSGAAWGLVSLFAFPFGALAWLVVRALRTT